MGNKLQNPRINLRLPDRNLYDDMQIHAHSNGQTLPAWAKATLIREMARSESKDILDRQSAMSLLTIQSLIEALSSPGQIDIAKRKARDYIKKVQSRDG